MHSTYESAEHDEQKFKRNEPLQTDDNTDDSNVSPLTRCILTNLTSTTGNSLKETNSLFQWLMIMLTVVTSTQDPDVLMYLILWYLWGVNICSYSVYFLSWGATKFCNCFLHCRLHLPWWRFHNQREVINLQRPWDLFCWLFDLFWTCLQSMGSAKYQKAFVYLWVHPLSWALYVLNNWRKGIPLGFWTRNENTFLSLTALTRASNLLVSLVS